MKTLNYAKLGIKLGVWLAAFGAGSVAFAQSPEPGIDINPTRGDEDKPDREKGKGFYTDNYHLKPSFALSTFFDSNVFRTSPNDTENTVAARTGSGVLRLTSSISGERQGSAEQNTFSFAAGLGYDQFISGEETVRNLSGLGGNLSGRYQYQPKGKTSFLLSNELSRTVTPRTIPTGELLPTFRQDSDRLIIATRLRPDGGALEQQIAYTAGLHLFEGLEFSAANHLDHDLSTYTKWNFLPRTALLFQAHLGYNDFFQDINRNPFGQVDSIPLRLQIGGIGLIGSRMQFDANVGYGNSFHQAPPGSPQDVSFHGVIGQASIKINLGDRDLLSAGYSHDFATTLFSNFIRRDQINLGWAHMFSSRLQATGTFTTSADRYSNIPLLEDQEVVEGVLSRVDVPISLDANLNYLARKDLQVGFNLNSTANISNFIVRDLNTGGLNDASYFIIRAGVFTTYTF